MYIYFPIQYFDKIFIGFSVVQSIVYKFSCVQTNYTSVHYDSTIRALKTRVDEHRVTRAPIFRRGTVCRKKKC